MKTICFLLFFVFVYHFIGTSGENTENDDNANLVTFIDRDEVKSERHKISQDSMNDTNKNESCDCGNNGTCSFVDGRNTCKCYDGYSEYKGKCLKCDCGENGNCSFGNYGKICDCDKGFAIDNGKCREVCDCGTRGICKRINGVKTCICDSGYVEYDGKCKACNCGEGGTCFFKDGGKICNCNKGYVESYGLCKACDCGGSYKNCSLSRYYEQRTCVCADGYAVKIEALWPPHESCYVCDCGKNGTCKFSYFNEKICTCNFGFEEVDGKCEEVCDCGLHEKCVRINGVKTCICESGYEKYNGICKACYCGPGKCRFTSYGSQICDCDKGYAVHSGRCYECDCGSNSTNCSYDNLGQRSCSCKDGFAAKSNKNGHEYCEDCGCGEGERCTLNYGVKRCLCSKGLKDINGKCQECDCGSNAEFCKLDTFKRKSCTCKGGYYVYRPISVMDDSCLDCLCGDNSIGCYFKRDESKVCKCKYGLVRKEEPRRCRECDCGIGAKSCIFTLTGKRQCTCYPNYKSVSDYTDGDSCTFKDISSYSEHSPGWRIATYVVSVLIVVIIIGMLIVIADKRSFHNRMSRNQGGN